MAYMHLDKPIIASYTDIAALLCVVQDESLSSTAWKYQLYRNLCWDRKSHTLYHCGKYDHFSYREFENESRIILHKLPKQTSYVEIKEYIDKGFFVLVPINTKLLGITEFPFKHNVFLSGYENDDFIVYDFWTPSFTWQYKKIDCKLLFQSIDFSNAETVQSFYVFRENESVESDNFHKTDWKELRTLLFTTLDNTKNEQYDTKKCAYGSAAYEAICDHLTSTSVLNLTDSQNFHVIYDHLIFCEYCLSILFKEAPFIQSVSSAYKDLINRANRLRTLAFKFYITKKDIGSVRELLVEEISTIDKIERMIAKDLINEERGTKI